MGEEHIFIRRKRRLWRKHISITEVMSGLMVLAALTATVVWIAVQRDNFSPADRDLPYELLAAQPVEDRLYRTPLKTWIAPGKATARSGGSAGDVDLGLFPRSILAGGWAISSRPRRFGPDTLFQKINGEAEKFLKQGFVELHYIALKSAGGAGEISIELYDQGSFAGGLGIFSSHRTGDKEILREGDTLYYTTPVGAIGFNGRYFFRFAADRENAAVLRKSKELVRAFAGLKTDISESPLPFRTLTAGMGFDLARIAYQRQNVFQYDFARDFWFAQPEGEKRGRIFLHEGDNPREAAKLFSAIAEEHGQEFSVAKRTKNSVLMRHPYLNTYFSMVASGPMLYGVDNEPDAGLVEKTMAKLARVIGKGGESK